MSHPLVWLPTVADPARVFVYGVLLVILGMCLVLSVAMGRALLADLRAHRRRDCRDRSGRQNLMALRDRARDLFGAVVADSDAVRDAAGAGWTPQDLDLFAPCAIDPSESIADGAIRSFLSSAAIPGYWPGGTPTEQALWARVLLDPDDPFVWVHTVLQPPPIVRGWCRAAPVGLAPLTFAAGLTVEEAAALPRARADIPALLSLAALRGHTLPAEAFPAPHQAEPAGEGMTS